MAVGCKKIKKDADFRKIFQTGKTIAGRFIFLKTKKTRNTECRLCFAAGLKVSKKAVERNKAKRRLKAIVGGIYPGLTPGYDVVVIAKREILKARYPEIKTDLIGALKKSKIFK